MATPAKFSEAANERALSHDESESGLRIGVGTLVEAVGIDAFEDRIPTLAELQRTHILRVLDHFKWNRTQTARALGIDVKTLYNKIRRFRLES